MSRLYPLLFIIIASICFYAGYTVGFKKGLITTRPSPKVIDKPIASSAIETIIVETPSEPVEEPPPLDAEAEAIITNHEYSLRAAQKEITFTDSQGRELVAEVIGANSQSLKIRRIADKLVIDLPVTMLCESDRKFAAYLAKHNTGTSSAPTTSKSMEDKIWEELFR